MTTKETLAGLAERFKAACKEVDRALERKKFFAREYALLAAPIKPGSIFRVKGLPGRYKAIKILAAGSGAVPPRLGWAVEAAMLRRNSDEIDKRYETNLILGSDKIMEERKSLPKPISLSSKAGRTKLRDLLDRSRDKM
jgi:hypothetical protein